MESRVWRRGPTRTRGLLYLARALLRGQEPARANGIDLAGVTIWRWWGWGAGCTLRGQLQVIRCWSPARSLIQESRVWVRGLTSTCQRVMHRWCLGAMAIIRTCQRDSPRWYHYGGRFWWWGAGYNLRSLLQVLPCGHTGATHTKGTHGGMDGPLLFMLPTRS